MTKRGRGSPRKHDKAEIELLQGIYPDIRTERGLRNKIHEFRAFDILQTQDIENLIFLFDSTHETLKTSILIERGKFDNDADLLVVAEHVCRMAKQYPNQKVHDWADYVRQIRLDSISETVSEK